MPQKRRTPRAGAGDAADGQDPLVQNILGQYYFALGQGAGGSMRVSREAIQALRERNLERIQNIAVDWNQFHIGVLEYQRGVGRHASLLATQDGRITITADDYNQAAELSERRAHEQHDQANIQFFGEACS